MTELSRRRRVGQAVFLLGLLAWGFGISYAEAGASTNANALFAGGGVVMAIGLYVIVQESRADEEG